MKKIAVFGFAFLFIFAVVLSLVIVNNWFLENIDLSINQIIPLIHNSFLISVAGAFAFIFDTWIMLVISLVISLILWIKKYRKEAGFFALLMIINGGVIFILKEVIARARPLNAFISDSGFTFPSGHATTAVVFFGLLCYLTLRSRRTGNFKMWTIIISCLMILLIGFSRIYLNVHWISDVFGGFFLGLAVLLLGIAIKEIFD